MKALLLRRPAPVETAPLELVELPIPEPGPGEALLRVEVCGVCRTDLHIVEGELPPPEARGSARAARAPLPGIVPGHEVVGRVERLGPGCTRLRPGDRVGAAWLHAACGLCRYCRRGDENLCDAPLFTGYHRPGGYAEYMTAPEAFLYPLPEPAPGSAAELAPLLCAGIIGYRALRRSELRPGEPLGLYGFGASAHLVLQIARYWDCPVYVFSRSERHRELARALGAEWVGSATETPPRRPRASILFAPAGELVPFALEALDRGGTLALAGIYMTPVPSLEYSRHLFQERSLRSVTANTRRDGEELLELAFRIPLRASVRCFPLEAANDALRALKEDRIAGAAVLQIA